MSRAHKLMAELGYLSFFPAGSYANDQLLPARVQQPPSEHPGLLQPEQPGPAGRPQLQRGLRRLRGLLQLGLQPVGDLRSLQLPLLFHLPASNLRRQRVLLPGLDSTGRASTMNCATPV